PSAVCSSSEFAHPRRSCFLSLHKGNLGLYIDQLRITYCHLLSSDVRFSTIPLSTFCDPMETDGNSRNLPRLFVNFNGLKGFDKVKAILLKKIKKCIPSTSMMDLFVENHDITRKDVCLSRCCCLGPVSQSWWWAVISPAVQTNGHVTTHPNLIRSTTIWC
ncbi:hypothetical protein AAFF_G00030370, partial [Aldrovandia affinis]